MDSETCLLVYLTKARYWDSLLLMDNFNGVLHSNQLVFQKTHLFKIKRFSSVNLTKEVMNIYKTKSFQSQGIKWLS